jgi:hypothetical protein
MAKSKLARFPPEVRKIIDLPKDRGRRSSEELIREFAGKSEAAMRALLHHYRLPQDGAPEHWPVLAMLLAADFLPAFRWAGHRDSPKRGPLRRDYEEELCRLHEDRQALKHLSDVNACERLAARYMKDKEANPFHPREMKGPTLRKYLPKAERAHARRAIRSAVIRRSWN